MGEGGIKNDQKIPTSFMDGPQYGSGSKRAFQNISRATLIYAVTFTSTLRLESLKINFVFFSIR